MGNNSLTPGRVGLPLPFTVIAGAVGGSDISAVNLKQCSMRPGGGDHKEHGLILVSSLVIGTTASAAVASQMNNSYR